MFTITNRIRILIALGAVGAAVGCTTASAATIVGKPVTVAPIVIVHHPVATAASHVGPVQGAGSAGIPGYDDATCAGLAQDNNTAVSYGDQAEQAGDTDTASSYYNQAANIYQQLSNNCLVID